MFNWPAYPFLRIVIAYIVGILICNGLGTNFDEADYIISAISCFSILVIFQVVYPKRFNIAKGIGLLITIVCFASYRFQSYSEVETIPIYKGAFQDTKSFTASITSYPSKRDKYYSYEANTRLLFGSDTTYFIKQKIKIYVLRNASTSPYKLGDIIHITGSLNQIKPPKNPYEFDYASYMKLSNIYYQVFTRYEKTNLLEYGKGKTLIQSLFGLRSYFEEVICRFVKKPKHQSIALALLLGIKDRLDTETKKAFSTAGAMHILAVSGLHIGVIHFIITWLFKPVRSKTFSQYIQPIISIALLWTYAMLTGFSASILRAATMFSIIILGNSLNRSPSIYNSISLSALILLVVKPTHLFSVGFQLSYLAVLGIVYLYPKFHKLYTPTTWVGNQVWSIICVSLAAQIATSPISILYFHQFPSYFLISNITVIPAAFIIMILGIVLILTNTLMISQWIAWLLNFILESMNWVVAFIQSLPYSLIDWIYLSPIDTVLIYALILYVIAFEHSRKIIWLKYTLICFLTLIVSRLCTIHTQSKRSQIIVYSHPKNTLIDHVSGLSAQLFTLKPINKSVKILRQVNDLRLNNYLPRVTKPLSFDKEQYLLDSSMCFKIFGKQKFLFVLNGSKWHNIKSKIATDYLIIENDASQSLEKINSRFSYKTLILATSNSYQTVNKLNIQAKSKHITPILINDGAYIINIKNY